MANNTPHKFIQFGCWNNLNEGKGCLRNVMNRLKQHIETDKPEFLVISGDNYYPDKPPKKEDKGAEEKGAEEKGDKKEKADKKKIIYLKNLIEGFGLLPDIQTYMILGNHDLETNVKGEKPKLFLNNGETQTPETDCKILETQFESIQGKNIDYCLYKSKELNHNTILFMIDTSIYEEKPDDYLPCYKDFLKKKKKMLLN